MREKRLLTIVPLALSILLLVASASATAQPGTVLAIADFADAGTDGGAMIQAERLSGYLQHRLQALAGDHLQVLAGDQVRKVMRAQGVTALDLLRRSRATGVAAALGASRIVTGSWRTLSLASAPDAPPMPRGAEREATAVFDVWMIDAASGATVLHATYVGRATGQGRLVLLEAAREALDQAARAIAGM